MRLFEKPGAPKTLQARLPRLSVLRKVLFLTAFLFAFFFFSHPDLWETAAHSYLFLQSLFQGRPLEFYADVAAHQNNFYYINNANYAVVIYIIFACWQLPLYLFHTLTGLAVQPQVLYLWSKCVSAGFFLASGMVLRRLCLALQMDETAADAAALFFLFDPVAFFSPMVMGQYDSICLFFTLLALCWYVKGEYQRFSLVLGVGVVCKFFPLLLLVPLLLLAEKRPLYLLRYGLSSLWLYLPVTLLYHGRTEQAPAFTQAMIDRLFRLNAETGIRGVSVFTLGYALLVFFALLYVPKDSARKNDTALYLCMAVYGWLFICIYWHPQWLLLLMPFVVLTTFRQKVRAPWFWLDLALYAGFFLNGFYEYPNQVSAGLLDGGLLPVFLGKTVGACGENWKMVSNFLEHIPYVWVLTPVLFCGAILGHLLFKLPLAGGSPAQRLAAPDGFHPMPLRVYGYGRFLVGFGCVWGLPVLVETLTAYGVIPYLFA